MQKGYLKTIFQVAFTMPGSNRFQSNYCFIAFTSELTLWRNICS